MRQPKQKSILLLFFSVFILQRSFTQSYSPTNIVALLELAEKNYPQLKAKKIEVQAAEKNAGIAKSSAIPSLDAAYQLSYATYNNITGMSYPGYLMPISGPPSVSNNFSGVFGSGAGIVFNWQPFTFGQRESQIAYAQAGVGFAKAEEQNDIFQHKVKVINAWLDWITAIGLQKVYEENRRRAEANLSVSRKLVVTGIKPGVDSALLKAEVSRAGIELLNSNKASGQAKIILDELLASDSIQIRPDTSLFTKLPIASLVSDTVIHPLISVYTSSIAVNKSKKESISKTTMPTLGIWSTAYGRGSGVDYAGSVKTLNGLGLQRFNYGVGVQLSIPILQSLRIRPQLQQQDLEIASNTEKLREAEWQISKQNDLADTGLKAALATAKESPVFFSTAVYAYHSMYSRYRSGLANYADLVQAQYGVAKADGDNRIIFISAWKALLYKASVKGDLNIFLNQLPK